MTNNVCCYTAAVAKYIIIVVFCVPKQDERFGSITELGPSASRE